MSDEKKSTYARIGAVAKAMELIETLASSREPMSAKEIADAVGIPTATVMCHLATLEDGRWVERIGGAYKPGMALAMVWGRYKARLQGDIKLAQQRLDELGD